jgi:ABC-2 type transport system ATP-binding protein
MSETAAVEVSELHKRFGRVRAVDGLGFAVERGRIFGLLGPNGAGKTTTAEILAGLVRPDAGRVTVLGLDALRAGAALKARVGVQLQATGLFQRLTVRETLALFCSFYARPLPVAELLRIVRLEEKAGAAAAQLSGGQRQRLAIGTALANDPELLLLDEPTTGLDPQVRLHLWDLVLGLRERGKTVVLTTHYMEEAERLCDEVLIVDHGRAVALGSPRELIRRHVPSATLRVAVALPRERLERLPSVRAVHEREGVATLVVDDATAALAALSELALEARTPLRDLALHQPTLEEVFLKLTGRPIRE